METPERQVLAEVRQQVQEAWKDVPQPPSSEIVTTLDDDSILVKQYFSGRQIKDVDLFDRRISQEHSFSVFTVAASHYYIQAYLLYCLDIDRHLRIPNSGCGDTPAIIAIDELCGKRGKNRMPPYTPDQRSAIKCLLIIIRDFPDFYYVRGRIDQLESCIKWWERAQTQSG